MMNPLHPSHFFETFNPFLQKLGISALLGIGYHFLHAFRSFLTIKFVPSPTPMTKWNPSLKFYISLYSIMNMQSATLHAASMLFGGVVSFLPDKTLLESQCSGTLVISLAARKGGEGGLLQGTHVGPL